MDRRARVRVSKQMSRALRHAPDTLGLTLDTAGWVALDALVDGLARVGEAVSIEDVLEIVRTSDKQRFALSADGLRVRANQGHSVDVELGLAPVEPPPTLYHGTSAALLEAIRREGLLRMGRTHVHLSADTETAEVVAKRRGGAIVLFDVDAAAMHRDGHAFYRADNGVWLTESVPPRYLATRDST